MIAFVLILPLGATAADTAPAPAPTSPPALDSMRFYESVHDAAEAGRIAELQQLFRGRIPPPPERLPRYIYYVTLANACLDAGLPQGTVRFMDQAGPPPNGLADHSWLAAIVLLPDGNREGFERIAGRYASDSPAFNFLMALQSYYLWRRTGPGGPDADELLTNARTAIERTTAPAARSHPEFNRRFFILLCNIREASGDTAAYAQACAERAAAFPRRAVFLRARLASAPFDDATLRTAAAPAGFSPEETAAWTRYLTAGARTFPTPQELVAAQLAEWPTGDEFDEARLIRLRLAMADPVISSPTAPAPAAALLQRYAQLALKLNRAAAAQHALRSIDARLATAPSDRALYAEFELDLIKLGGDRDRAITLIHEAARENSRNPAWLKRHVEFVYRCDNLIAAHSFLRRLTQMEPENLLWKLNLATLPDRDVDFRLRIADAQQLAEMALARVTMSPEELDKDPPTVFTDPNLRLTLYAEVFARVPATGVLAWHYWMTYEKLLQEEAERPFIAPDRATWLRGAFPELVARCVREKPDHPTLRALSRHLAEQKR